jgi:hypothetical protein
VNDFTLKARSEKMAKAIQCLHYIAHPIDALIQAIAMPIFTFIDHMRNLPRGGLGNACIKVLLTPITLPIKIACSLLVSIGYLFNGLIHLLGLIASSVTDLLSSSSLDPAVDPEKPMVELTESSPREVIKVYLNFTERMEIVKTEEVKTEKVAIA